MLGLQHFQLFVSFNLFEEFPESVLNEAKRVNIPVSEDNQDGRKDYRNRTIITIDGEDAKDLDDAIMIEKTADGEHYILDVHIADVSHYVRDRSKLDREARIRGTSVYMLDRVIPMLPRELSNGLCSLNAGEDRYTLSVQMEIDKEGNVVASDMYKGIIRVTERMNYSDVQKILDGSDEKF